MARLARRLRGEVAALAVDALDSARGMIPSSEGSTDLLKGGHRNVLAIMVLGWRGHLYPGPCHEGGSRFIGTHGRY
ncbi:MAG: DUF3541 domain-containing protein [Halomonas sp.]